MRITKCKDQHLLRVTEIFQLAFKESIDFFAPGNPRIGAALLDIFSLLTQTFDEGFLVVEDEAGQVQGYIVAADNVKRLWINAFRSGLLCRWLGNWMGGQYGIGLTTAARILLNKLCYLRFEAASGSAAQILSVAVDPAAQGKGYGRALVEAGLKHLKATGAKRVKLEVRPNNAAAVNLYTHFGFAPMGKARDLQGEWLVMQAHL
ncbi:MAG: GNAT family N-acetyltransferase [bacterium]|jgi:ribosomal-protein-alanine N-acetyltransferase